MARRFLAFLLLAMALGQVSDLRGFVDIFVTYDLGNRAVAWSLAAVLVAGETLAGVGLFRGAQGARHRASIVAVAVALAWTGLATQAFARGLDIANCGCFGVHLGQSLRWWVLLEDAEFVALALWVGRGIRRPPAPGVAAPTEAGDRQPV